MSGFHLAGIIPVAGQPLDFQLPWHDCMMPIGKNFLAIERSVLECAYAGCETIWIVCNDDMQPLIRYRLGDYVQDPVWVHRKFAIEKDGYQKLIPIQYVPVHPKDRKKRDCLSWSVIYGSWTADRISSQLSRWLKPNKYYVSFPYGVYDYRLVREHRKDISSRANFYFKYESETVVDGTYLGFTMNEEDYKKILSEVRGKSTGLYKDQSRNEKLSMKDRFSYRFMSLEDIFNSLTLKNSKVVELPYYYAIDNWYNYCNYIGEKGTNFIEKPSSIIRYKEWNGIGIDEEKD